jgi:tetratricopeptide (TPR) repeat protein
LPRPRAANTGLDASHGELITFLDHDDEFLPGHLSGLAAALATNTRAGASYCRFEVYEAGSVFTTIGRPFDRVALHEKSYIHHSALLFRRSLLDTGIRYDEALDIHDDWDFVLQLSEHTRFAYVDQCTFRWHSDIGTSGGGGVGNFDGDKFQTQRNYVLTKWAPRTQAHVERFNRLVETGMSAAQRGAFDEAQRLLDEALDDAQDDADLLNTLAMLAHRRGSPAEARDLVQRAVAVREADPRLWFNLGLACAQSGDAIAARRAFERVLTLTPGHAAATQWLGRLGA